MCFGRLRVKRFSDWGYPRDVYVLEFEKCLLGPPERLRVLLFDKP